MKNKFFGIAILFLLLINLSFILAQENQEIVLGENTINFDSEKVDYKVVSLDGEEIIQLDFTQGGFAEIKGVRFENILPASESLNPSYMKLDTFGNILEADLTANEKGSIFLINGLTFKAPPNSRVYYDEASFFHLKDVSITNIEKDKLSSLDNFLIFGERINFFNELLVDSGRVYIKDGGYIISDGNFVYKNVEINQGVNSLLIEKNHLRDLSNYKDNFIQETESGLKIQSTSGALGINLRFLENNEFFDVKDIEDKEGLLDMEISYGDKLEIIKKDYFLKGLPPLIKHGYSEKGQTIIKDGRHIFRFENGEFSTELGNLNTRNKLSSTLGIESDIIKEKIINLDNNNGYSISELGKGNIFSFNKALLSPPNYHFESEVGKKIYSFAEEQIGNSAFVHEGRGQCYGEEQIKLPGFDCIGLAISSLKKVYPDSSLKDFPPNLKLVDSLKEKGWNDFIIEPTSVQNNVKTTEAVKNIPAGSVVFLMHDYQSYSPEEIGGVIEGIDYQNYLNSRQEKTFLVLGHTLIKGTGKKNFINAYPNVRDSELPLRARKINENLKKQGKPPIFIGTVREGELIPQEDYLLVISPPRT
ncbi:MAG: hypothetical protein QT10_C0002G0039 [archaeon GW2011_AR19]|nr:MAG: hypothetical protein QT10_C0002G0039 [archaeon GW2011_AR19]